jgi:hypothetical protein
MEKPKQPAHMIYDTRVIQRNLHEGVITQADVNNWIEKLPDAATKAEPVRTTLGRDDDGGYDDGDQE